VSLFDSAVRAKDAVRLQLEGVEFVGVVAVVATATGLTDVHVIGGNGRLGARVAARQYKKAPARLVIEDALRDAGQTTGRIDAPELREQFIRLGAPVVNVLRGLVSSLGREWRVGRDGAFTVVSSDDVNGNRALEEIDEPISALRRFVVELTPDLEPNEVVTFSGQTGLHALDAIEHHVEGNAVRTVVWTRGSA
jgi:hypothetical protein